MKQSDLKDCFRAITPTKEQTDRVLASVLKQRNVSKGRVYSRYIYAFASLMLVLSLSFACVYYMDLEDKQKLAYKGDDTIPHYTQKIQSIDTIDADEQEAVEHKSETGQNKNSTAKPCVEQAEDSLEEARTEEATDEAVFDKSDIPLTGGNNVNSNQDIDVETDSSDIKGQDSNQSVDAVSGGGSSANDFSGASGGSGGGGGSAAKPNKPYREYSIDELRASERYSMYIPSSIPQGYSLDAAYIRGDVLSLNFVSPYGNVSLEYISGSNSKTIDISADISEYKALEPYTSLAISMGERYVLIYAPAACLDDVHAMIKSCNYFK